MRCGFNVVSNNGRCWALSYLFLGEIARRQVYMSFSPLSDENTTKTFQSTEGCIAEIRTWLKDNKLMLNDDKKMYL